jgi:hypothetical protein
VEGIKESLVEDSLQKGKIISFPFLNGYTELPELLQAYLFLPKLKFYIERQVGNYYLRDGREGNFNFFII